MFVGTALSVHLLVCAGLSLFIICGPYLSVVVCVFYAYNLTLFGFRKCSVTDVQLTHASLLWLFATKSVLCHESCQAHHSINGIDVFLSVREASLEEGEYKIYPICDISNSWLLGQLCWGKSICCCKILSHNWNVTTKNIDIQGYNIILFSVRAIVVFVQRMTEKSLILGQVLISHCSSKALIQSISI